MIEPEDEYSVLFHVSVSDVQPHIDHASRALATRRRHAVTWTAATAGFLVGVLAVTLVALSSFGAPPSAAQALEAQRWSHPVQLDSNRLLIEPPSSGDHPGLTRDETLALLQASQGGQAGPSLTIVQARWGRVSVRDAQGALLAGFDRRSAWAVVFRVHDDTTACPTTSTPAGPTPDSGDYTGVQVFVVSGADAQLLYSQAGSWSCGLPAQPLAALPEDAS